MRTRIRKHKLGSTKPASQLFLFSNKLNENIDTYFSGNVVVEIEIDGYDYKYHDEAKQVVELMSAYCKLQDIELFKYLTVILNYKISGLTLANLSGDYHYPIAVQGLEGYKELATVHSAYKILKKRLKTFESYSTYTMQYAYIAQTKPLKLSQRSALALDRKAKVTEQSINAAISDVFHTFHNHFKPKHC